ncbi:MAG: cytochrome b/b6 domain-containing protein [Rhodobacteraceae bacterium]|nr:cytochrome b/b6 domain-containing protein [Paracoccaceae bacterium]
MENSAKRIWDLPIRISHWSLAFSFTAAFLTAEMSPLIIHETFAFLTLTIVIFRLFWGIIGSDTARFSNFVRGRSEIKAYIQELLQFRHKEYWGHNPLGAIAVVVILVLMFALVGAGLFASEGNFNGPWATSVSRGAADLLKELHEILAGILVFVALVHVAAIIGYRVFLRDDLIKPMITGMRPAAEGISEPRFSPLWLAIICLAVAVVISGAIFRYWLF